MDLGTPGYASYDIHEMRREYLGIRDQKKSDLPQEERGPQILSGKERENEGGRKQDSPHAQDVVTEEDIITQEDVVTQDDIVTQEGVIAQDDVLPQEGRREQRPRP